MFAVNIEPIPFHPAGNASVLFQKSLYLPAQGTQNPVAELPAVLFINKMEIQYLYQRSFYYLLLITFYDIEL